MKKARRLYGRILIAAAVVAAPLAHAQGSLEDCAQIGDDSERLACYDELAGRVMPGTGSSSSLVSGPASADAAGRTTAAGTTAAGTTAAVAASNPEADFGLSDKAIKQRDPGKWVESVTGKVINVALAASDRYVITLDNGQVWMQSETNTRQILSPGDTVTIKRAALGSYKLSGPRSVYWRVRRLR